MINMDNIMSASLYDDSNSLRVVFKKTIQKRQYEPEVIEVETTVNLDGRLLGPERMLILAIIAAQVEYTAMVNLVYKGQISPEELDERKRALVNSVNALKEKAEKLTGTSMEHIIFRD